MHMQPKYPDEIFIVGLPSKPTVHRDVRAAGSADGLTRSENGANALVDSAGWVHQLRHDRKIIGAHIENITEQYSTPLWAKGWREQQDGGMDRAVQREGCEHSDDKRFTNTYGALLSWG